ncbi:hypothetical protein C3L33_16884, partial [Rhododendron williamsianum]
MSSVFTYPPSHRYHNCTSSDDDGESEAMEFLESDSDDNQESDSLFSISIESRNQISAPETDEKEVNSPIPARSLPDEQICESDAVEGSRKGEYRYWGSISHNSLWRRASFEVLNGDFKRRFKRSKPEVDDVAVDTSLSSWLVESETTSISKNSTPNDSVGNSPGRVNSSRRYEDRRILGALTVEELR